jgi:hypothetical protein
MRANPGWAMHKHVDYGGTYPGLTIRRSTGQRTYVAFTNGLDPAARYDLSTGDPNIAGPRFGLHHPDSTAANDEP